MGNKPVQLSFEESVMLRIEEAEQKFREAIKKAEEAERYRLWLEEMEKKKNEQEYVPVSFPRTDHLPVVFRVSLRGSTVLGRAFWGDTRKENWREESHSYAFVFLDNLYRDKPWTWHDEFSCFDEAVLEVYWHEFFHLYFAFRFDEDVDTFDWVPDEDGSMKKQNYRQNRSRKWKNNERVIDAVAVAMMKATYDKWWVDLFADVS